MIHRPTTDITSATITPSNTAASAHIVEGSFQQTEQPLVDPDQDPHACVSGTDDTRRRNHGCLLCGISPCKSGALNEDRIRPGQHDRAGPERTALSPEGTGCKRVYSEQKSGANGDRAALQRMLKEVQPGDIVVVTRLDQLARSVRDLLNILERFRQDESEIAPELTGHGLPLSKCEAYNRVYEQSYGSR
jgi:Resolvase, N terminal domain